MTEPTYRTRSQPVQVFHMNESAMADRESWPEWLTYSYSTASKRRYVNSRGSYPCKTFKDGDYAVLKDGTLRVISPAQFAIDYEPVPDDESVIVDFHKAGLPVKHATFEYSELKFADNRSVGVGICDGGERVIIIERPVGEKRSQLKLGLSCDASIALMNLLVKSYSHEPVPDTANHDISIGEMIDAEDEQQMGLLGRDSNIQFIRLCSGYNYKKAMVQDLAMLVRRLLMTIKHHSIWPMVAQQAHDYLTRHHLQSPLRETKGEKV